jgi:hypothetical protein
MKTGELRKLHTSLIGLDESLQGYNNRKGIMCNEEEKSKNSHSGCN